VTDIDVEALSRRYGPMVLRRCRRLLGDEQEALDACQDVFVRIGSGGRGWTAAIRRACSIASRPTSA
jgi:DNA-directed RNA polymerase specialized sigma24 family protein